MAKIQPDEPAGDQQDNDGSQPGRHTAPLTRFGPTQGRNSSGGLPGTCRTTGFLLTGDPSGMDTNRQPERAGPKGGGSENEAADEQRQNAKAENMRSGSPSTTAASCCRPLYHVTCSVNALAGLAKWMTAKSVDTPSRAGMRPKTRAANPSSTPRKRNSSTVATTQRSSECGKVTQPHLLLDLIDVEEEIAHAQQDHRMSATARPNPRSFAQEGFFSKPNSRRSGFPARTATARSAPEPTPA